MARGKKCFSEVIKVIPNVDHGLEMEARSKPALWFAGQGDAVGAGVAAERVVFAQLEKLKYHRIAKAKLPKHDFSPISREFATGSSKIRMTLYCVELGKHCHFSPDSSPSWWKRFGNRIFFRM